MSPTLLGVIATLIATATGGYAAIQSHRTERRSATRHETQQALDAQSELLDRYEKRIEVLETSIETALARHAKCEARLMILERQVVELGGSPPPREML